MKVKTKYKIFDSVVEINIEDQSDVVKNNLARQLEYYEIIDDKIKSDIVINIANSFSDKIKMKNPSIHAEFENGFWMKDRLFDIGLKKNESQIFVNISLKVSESKFVEYLRKINNIEYASREERIGQIFFEAALIPALFFDSSKLLVHSSAFSNKKGEAILIGGTGGVGKTSLEIELCMNRGFGFINDDISVITGDGYVHPNLAFPKIYSYNLKDNDDLKQKIFAGRSFTDRFFWHIKQKLFGADKVRRKIFPENVYSKCTTNKLKLSKYIVLVKKDTPNLLCTKINSELACEMHINVIKAEYYNFINHIFWHQYNALAGNFTPIINFSYVENEWRNLGRTIFSKADCYMLEIPFEISHKNFVNSASEIIEKLSNS